MRCRQQHRPGPGAAPGSIAPVVSLGSSQLSRVGGVTMLAPRVQYSWGGPVTAPPHIHLQVMMVLATVADTLGAALRNQNDTAVLFGGLDVHIQQGS